MVKFVLKTNKPVAFDSPDHIVPRGTKYDNTRNMLFNKKLEALFGHRSLYVLDLGCAGGGFVKDCLEDGHFAVGLEGSDYSKKLERAEWRTIPANLFTCDITEDFSLSLSPSEILKLLRKPNLMSLPLGKLWNTLKFPTYRKSVLMSPNILQRVASG
jgi:hypothetical protein